MDQQAMSAPKLLLYHDLTLRRSLPADEAAHRLDAQLTGIRRAGMTFRTMQEYVEGRLGPRDVVVTFDDALRSFHDVAWPVLRHHNVSPALFVVSGFAGRSDAREVLMNWDEVAALAEQGVSIGCHAATHVPLDQIEPTRMHDEISRSASAFEARGIPVNTFAYPFGRYSDAVKNAVEAAGFQAAFTVMKGGADRFEIRRRLLTGGEPPWWFRFALSDRFFEVRDGARAVVPRRFLKQEQPVARSRWGAAALGLPELEPEDGSRV